MTIKIFLSAYLCMLSSFGFSQVDSTSKRITEKDFIPGRTYAKDTVINGITYYKEFIEKSLKKVETVPTIDKEIENPQKNIPAEIDSLSVKRLEDLSEAKELDKKWLDELYSMSLYDTIYKSVSELTYEPIDYPELTTGHIKSQIKTP